MTLPPVLTIAGSDSSGGAGIQADLKTITTLGCYGMSAITALTAQNTMGIQDILPVPANFLTEQLDAVCSDIPPAAVKIGMVYDAPQIHAIAKAIRKYHLPHIVLDPVLSATSGDTLLVEQAYTALQTELFPLAELITPNIPEAEHLTGMTIQTQTDMETVAKQLSEQFHTAILLKGGHALGQCSDFLFTGKTSFWFHAQRISSNNTHGTGCTLSSAIASFLAQQKSLPESVRAGKEYLTGAIQADLMLGHGHGPLAHNYK